MVRIIGALILLMVPAVAAQSPFQSIPPAVSDSLRFGAPVPDFKAKDIDGRTWRPENLHGKYTLILIWYTFSVRDMERLTMKVNYWGLPALPELQHFNDKTRQSKNIQVLAFCSDYDYTHAPAYMREKGYTFPLIADWVLLKKLFPAGGTLVVNPEGRVSEPFRSWTFGRLLFEIEKAAAAT